MAQQITETRSYRCSYHPKDSYGNPIASDSGLLPYVQLKAENAENAYIAAIAVTGCVVAVVERLEGGAA